MIVPQQLAIVQQHNDMVFHFNQLLLILRGRLFKIGYGSSSQSLTSFYEIFFSPALNFTSTTKADLTSADNYIQHLLWLITPEYQGEPGYRNYTIAMILIFIAISVVVMHVLLFGFMLPF